MCLQMSVDQLQDHLDKVLLASQLASYIIVNNAPEYII